MNNDFGECGLGGVDDSTDSMDFDDSTDSTIRLNIGNFNSDCGHSTTRQRRLDFDDSTDLIDFDDSTDSAIRLNI